MPEGAEELVAIIMAGGSGSRLWPVSRRSRPKQLQPLIGDRTMVQATVDRLAGLVPPERIFVLTSRELIADVRQQLPEVPANQIVGEPAPLGTAPAAALGAAVARAFGHEGVVCLLPADHAIAPDEGFRATIRQATQAASAGYLTTIGIPPAFPATGYGYVELGPALPHVDGAYAVARFVEKPTVEAAEELLGSGRCLWNAGMFLWTVPTAFAEFERHLPDLGSLMPAMAEAMAQPDFEAALDAVWARVTDRTTLDYGIAERSDKVAGVIAEFTWSDVGAWDALADVLEPDAQGNIVLGPHIGYESTGCIVVSQAGRLVATLGLRDLIIVDSDDALLVCPRDRAQDVRRMVDELQRMGEEDVL
jgi:mannose-1-phosphate guanylyltransferase